jgi:Spy/CpxP family protein refolding chaperone
MKTPFREIIVALLIGAAVGWFAAVRFAPERPHPRMQKGQMLERFSRDLNLTPDQKTQIGRIFEARQAQFAALKSEMRPKSEEIRSASRAEIKKILTAEQQEAFDRLEAKSDALRKEKRARWEK